jgi:hypothetical protein
MAAAAGTRQEHRYWACRDDYCDRFPCRVYKEGQRDGEQRGYHRGYADGYAKGYDEGYGAGYSAGFAEGLASCPGPHGAG